MVTRGATDDPEAYPDPGVELRLIERYAPPARRDVLEIGCGEGRLTFQYAERARSVIALDPNTEQIQRARTRARQLGVRNVRYRARTAQDGLRGGPFDVVLFSWSL
jgi:2-polyprenyl-3-methyl-5-hydroxy-6-metoxy-1,4-benzoquinol methylase